MQVSEIPCQGVLDLESRNMCEDREDTEDSPLQKLLAIIWTAIMNNFDYITLLH